MTRRTARCRVLFSLLLLPFVSPSFAADTAQVTVYFSPNGGCTEAVVRELSAAQKQVLVQAYAFTSAPIAKALVEAHKRGVIVKAILDKSNETAKYSSATFLLNSGLPVLIDDKHAIAHNKIMVLDGSTVLTGSFNFTKAAEQSNAENLVILKDSPALVQRYTQNFETHAAHSHAYQHGVSGSAPQASHTSQVTASGQIHANRESKIYHLPSCSGYERVGEANMVMFTTESTAKRAGYRKAKNCP